MKIQLSDHFSLGRLMRFTIPSIIMMVFTSVYGVVDGFFVSNLVGKTPFAAVNFIWPFLMILGAVGFMFGAGGGALIAKTLGEGKHEKAQRLFSMFVYVTAGCGIGIGNSFVRGSSRRPVSAFLLSRISRAIMQYQHAGSAFYKWPFQSDHQQYQTQSRQPAE